MADLNNIEMTADEFINFIENPNKQQLPTTNTEVLNLLGAKQAVPQKPKGTTVPSTNTEVLNLLNTGKSLSGGQLKTNIPTTNSEVESLLQPKLPNNFIESFTQSLERSLKTGIFGAAAKVAGFNKNIPSDVPGLFTPTKEEVPIGVRIGATLGTLTGIGAEQFALNFLSGMPGLGLLRLFSFASPAVYKTVAAGAGAALAYQTAYTYTTEDRLPTTGEALFSAGLGAGLSAAGAGVSKLWGAKITKKANELQTSLKQALDLPDASPYFETLSAEQKAHARNILKGDFSKAFQEVIKPENAEIPQITNVLYRAEQILEWMQQKIPTADANFKNTYKLARKNYNEFINMAIDINPAVKQIYQDINTTKFMRTPDGVPLFNKLISNDNIVVNPRVALELAKEPAQAFPSLARRAAAPLDPARMAERYDGVTNGTTFREIIAPLNQMSLNKVELEKRVMDATKTNIPNLDEIRKLAEAHKETIYMWKAGQITTEQALQRGVPTSLISAVDTLERTCNIHLGFLNNVRQSLGLDPIPKRDRYAPHIFKKDFDNIFRESAFENRVVFESAAGKSDIKRGWMKARTQELPDTTKLLNPIDAYEQHIKSLIDVTVKMNTIPGLLAKVRFMEPQYRDWFTTYLNRLMYEKPAIEQQIAKIGAEGLLNAVHKITSTASSNLLAFNIYNMAQQSSQLLPTMATSGLGNWVKGTVMQLTSKRIDDLIEKSPMMKLRLLENIDIQPGWYATPTKFGHALIRALDTFFTKNTFAAAYYSAKAHGFSEEAAIKAAAHATAKIQAFYHSNFRPLFLNSKLGQTTAPLSTFSFNLWNLITNSGDRRFFAALNNTSTARQFLGLMAAIWATNYIWETAGIQAPNPMAGVKGLGIPMHPLTIPMQRGTPGMIPAATKKALEFLTDGTFAKIFHDDPEVSTDAMFRMLSPFGIAIPGGTQLHRSIEALHKTKHDVVRVQNKIYPITPLEKILAITFGMHITSPTKDVLQYKKLKRAGIPKQDVWKLQSLLGEEQYD